MASIGNQILIKMGLDSSQLQKGLNQSKQKIKATGQAIDAMGAKWKATASMLTRTVIAPIAGFMSLGAVIKSYFSGVAQVAQLTGAYSQKMEEWRKKRAMLARYNREDIELYKKGREAVTKFQITMDDLSAKIMRSISPAIKWLIDRLNDFSNWIGRNSQNIIRFFSVVAGVITAILIPAFLNLAVAMLTNPLTWIIGLIGLLILVIDDLVTYLRGGESVLGVFWKPLIEYTKIAWDWITKFFKAFSQSDGVKAIVAITLNWWSHLANGLKQLWDLTVRWFNLCKEKTNDFKGIVEVFKGVFQTIWGLFETLEAIVAGVLGAIVALFTGDTTMLKNAWKLLCDGLENDFKGAFKIIEGVVIHVKGIFDALKETINKIVDAVMNFGSALKNAFKGTFKIVEGIIQHVKTIFNEFLDVVNRIIGAFAGVGTAIKNAFKGTFKIVEGIIQHVKTIFNEFLDVVNRIIGAFAGVGTAIKNALNIDSLVEKAKTMLSNMIPDWMKSTLGISDNQKGDKEPTIYAGTDAPIVYDNNKDREKSLKTPVVPDVIKIDAPVIPDVASMQTMQAQSKGNSNTNISREQNFYINTNSPAVADQVVTSASDSMSSEDRAISMASQGATW